MILVERAQEVQLVLVDCPRLRTILIILVEYFTLFRPKNHTLVATAEVHALVLGTLRTRVDRQHGLDLRWLVHSHNA